MRFIIAAIALLLSSQAFAACDLPGEKESDPPIPGVAVQRDDQGAIVGLYANKQDGFAEECLPDDDEEVAAFRAALEAPPPASRDLAAELDALKQKLDRASAATDALVEKGALTEQEIEAKKPQDVKEGEIEP